MNKKMRELLAKIEENQTTAKGFLESGDTEKAQGCMTEIEDLQKQYEIAEKLFKAEQNKVDPEKAAGSDEKASGIKTMTKMLKRQNLSDAEKALISGGMDGENYIIPQDIRTEIRELRKQYKSAKELVTIEPTNTLSGSFTYESGTPAGLASLTDGADITVETNPSFVLKPFAVKFFAKLIPVSRILSNAETGGLMGYLNRWFVKNAIITENNAIFAALKAGKTVKAVKGWEALKKSINTDVDPDCLYDAVIVTNQTGFAVLDEEKFADGRPVLQENPADPTRKLFQGLPVHVFSDAQLPNVGGKAPMFYGSLKAGCSFVDYEALEFATSDQYMFGKNQTCIRVIEGFDVIGTDVNSYIYATFEATPAAPAG